MRLHSFHDLPEGMKAIGDLLSISALLGWLVSALPNIATLLTVIWLMLRIYEMETVKKLLGKQKDKP